MVRYCEEEDCKEKAYWKYKDDKYAKFCKEHKKDEMIHIRWCEHNKIKSRCKECEGGSICEHNKIKSQCKECGGSQICEHNKQKSKCKECGGSALCKSSWCETRGNKKYKGYCLRCFMHTFPAKPVARNYKTKERNVVERVKERYPNFDWICDKVIPDGCSKRRPDMFLDMGSYIIIVEIDENQHEAYDSSCENKRIMQIWEDVGCRQMIFIRFNPDSYKDKEGKNITSCWSTNKQGILVIKKEKEWDKRINKLLEEIEYWSNNEPEELRTIRQLFYDLN